MSTIPASAVVNVTPNVLDAGGTALDLIGLLLSTAARVPIGTVQSFPTAAAVGDYFGASSDEKALADVYFNGFDNSNSKPGAVLFAQYPQSAVAAFLRGADVSTFTLAELQALSGLLSVTIDGSVKSATISLSAATSFSGAAEIIGQSLAIHGAQAAAITGSISGTTLTVSAVASGTISVGDVVGGTGVTANTYISALLTGTGGTGTYTVSTSQTAISASMTIYEPGVEYDSVSGAFFLTSATTGTGSTITYGSGALATSLLLTLATGAVISQGAAAASPGTFMDGVVAVTQNWATFMTCFDPDASGNTNKLAFAAWTSAQNQRYAYAAWDTDASPTVTVPATSSLGYLIAAAEYSGTILVWAPDGEKAAFVCDYAASLDFAENDGRATLKFRSQSGLDADVTDGTVASNLAANGYNFYGAYATANDSFVFMANGVISGDFLWADSYVNQIQFNAALQLALVTLLTQRKSIPYNAAGNALIEAACADPINAALNFGTIRQGVTLSAAQVAEVNADAGAKISNTLSTRGWYLQVLPASAVVRAARGSPPCKLWYMDGQSVQQIDLTSVNVQ